MNKLKKIQALYVCYDASTYPRTGLLKYNQAKLVNPASLPQDWAYYEENQNVLAPIYYTSDKSLFIAPLSTGNVANGLKLTGIRKITDYDSSTTEDDMKIPDDYLWLLIDGLVVQFMYKKSAFNTALQAQQAFDQNMTTAMDTIKNLNVSPVFTQYPDSTYGTIDPSLPKIY